MAELSGAAWVDRFPTSTSIADLVEPFKTNVTNFKAALDAAGASISIDATYRPPERAYLMHYAYKVANEGLAPGSVPAYAGVDIKWLHTTADGKADLAASRAAAAAMVSGYGIVYAPALKSRHTEGKAIDWSISWSGSLVINDAQGTQQTIDTTPRTGAANVRLRAVGATYGVQKLVTDPPHWSTDGH